MVKRTGIENRKLRRYHVQLSGCIHDSGHYIKIGVNNISKRGAEVTSDIELPLYRPAYIEIQLDENTTLGTECTLAWMIGKGSSYNSGLVFTGKTESEIEDILVASGLINAANVLPIKNPRLEAFDIIFEDYHDEIFLRRAREYVDYIKEEDPEEAEQAEKKLQELTQSVVASKKYFKKWAKTRNLLDGLGFGRKKDK
ncbi:MAG: PilZ domain-containing protein [Elusimicrobiota bacterium]